MKAMVETCFASRRHHDAAAASGLPVAADGKVRRPAAGASSEAEIRALFAKLKALVPVPPGGGRNMSRTEILQCVIDYIFDLEVTLEGHPLCCSSAEEDDEASRVDDCAESDDDLRAREPMTDDSCDDVAA